MSQLEKTRFFCPIPRSIFLSVFLFSQKRDQVCRLCPLHCSRSEIAVGGKMLLLLLVFYFTLIALYNRYQKSNK